MCVRAGTCPSGLVSGGWLMGVGADGRAGETDHANVCVLGYSIHHAMPVHYLHW